ncbi:PAS domain-containing protein [uncultured Alsobacter sp.]|uniref:PAS domain-containing protein n=1 Tax=uncultured Alsobacter sp. TaxID=1748258 RepID=UPI0025FD021F|nr:PAS domain-containing protein [uncultured Alsobacter sp.]
MRHATTCALFAYWDQIRGDRLAPERSEIEPGAIRTALADTFMLDVEADGSHPFRLAGTRVCALFGRELKDTPFSLLWRSPANAVGAEGAALVRVVCDEARPAVAGVVGQTEDGEQIELELLLLPLRHRGRTHARVLGCLSAATLPPWFGLTPLQSLHLVSMRIVRGTPRVAQQPVQQGPTVVGSRRGHLRVFEGGLTT